MARGQTQESLCGSIRPEAMALSWSPVCGLPHAAVSLWPACWGAARVLSSTKTAVLKDVLAVFHLRSYWVLFNK